MTPAQRQQLAGLRHRVGLDAAKRLVATMERIDQRPPLRRSFRAARIRYRCERFGACVVIAIFLAVALFVGTHQ